MLPEVPRFFQEIVLRTVRDVSSRSMQMAAGDADTVLLRAPVAGRVLRLHLASAATVTAGTPLLELGDVGALEVVVELLTGDALQVRPGSAVRIERWGGPQALAGTVRSVEPAGFTKVSALGVEEQRVRVLIELTSPPAQWASLGDGFRVGVRVVTRQAERVLRVPVGAVFPRPAGMPADVTRAIADGIKRGASPELAAKLKTAGLVLSTSDGVEATRALIAAEAPRWKEMVETSGAKIE
jgi:HlyD family secretion protein